MADFDAPPGPPPPKVPEGWVARWNDQYKEWFYVNTFTKKSQWEKPTEPARRPGDDDFPAGPPPSYTPSANTPAPSDAKSKNPFDDNKLSAPSSSNNNNRRSTEDDDARLARQLQAEEDARAARANSRSPSGRSPFPDQLPPRPDNVGNSGGDKSRGLLGKLFNKRPQQGQQQQGYGGNPPAQYASYGGSPAPQPAPYGGGGYAPPPQAAGYYQQPAYGGGGYAQPAYGGYPPQGGYYPPQQPAVQQQSSGRTGGGMGMMGGAALGVGAGLLGGLLIEDVIQHDEQQAYQQGFDNGADYGGGGYDGGDFDNGGF